MTKTAVYRHYDATGRLLYVGAARSFGNRTQTHLREAAWVSESVRAEATFFETREAALEAEAAAIQSENPIFNLVRHRRSMGPPQRAKTTPVGDLKSPRGAAFAALWAEYLKGRYHSAYAVEKAFCIDSKTARDWISGKRDPSGSFVATVIARDPDAIAILGRAG